MTHTNQPAVDLSEPFNARYAGWCRLPSCEKNRNGEIELGDVCQYVDDDLMHMVCARRVARDQTAPFCGECFCYHNGECA